MVIDIRFSFIYRIFIMSHSKLPVSLRKFLRKEKARMRREIFDPDEQKKRIAECVEKTFAAHTRIHRPQKVAEHK